jgi:hypothetical protein
MVKKYAASSHSYDQRLAKAAHAVAVHEVPVAEGSNTFNIYPASVGAVRKALFELLEGTPQEAGLATRCLIAIDYQRDEYGIAANDPRHPNVMSGKPWPPEAAPTPR